MTRWLWIEVKQISSLLIPIEITAAILPNLYQQFGRIRCSAWDAMEITGQDPVSREAYMENSFLKCGIPGKLLEHMPPQSDISVPVPPEKISVAEEQDVFSYGRYRFRVLDLKGHMPGMIGFYDEGAGIFFCGDHVLNKITPNIGYYKEGDHSLANYINNLKKIRNLPVTHVFPAHRGEISCLSERVDEILEHHRERLDEITGVLSAKPMCAFEAAGKMTWYYKEGNFQKLSFGDEMDGHLRDSCSSAVFVGAGRGQPFWRSGRNIYLPIWKLIERKQAAAGGGLYGAIGK